MKSQRQCLLKYILYMALFNRRKSQEYKQKIQMFKDNTLVFPREKLKRINLNVVGKNNTVVIKDTVNAAINISVFGDNNSVYIDDNVYAGWLDMVVGQNHMNFGPVHDCDVRIGKNTSFESTNIVIKNSKAKIHIGKNCMFAFNVTLYHTDSHPIFDLDTGKIINKVKTMRIGDHVWVGANATILKNTQIPNDCIVGWGAVVSGKFDVEHSVITGNPGKVVKTNITWDSNGSKGYVQNE